MFKRLFRVVSMLLLALAVAVPPVCAVKSGVGNKKIIQGYVKSDKEILLLVDNMEGERLAAKEQFSVTINDKAAAISQTAYADLPILYYCLVDISGSLNQGQLAQQKDVLNALCDKLRPGDQMAVVWLGNEVTSSGILCSQEDIRTAIAAIETQPKEDTNLYGGIVKSIEKLRTSSDVQNRVCMVVLSDGKDDHAKSVTQDNVDRAVIASGFPFYGVAVMKSSQADNETWTNYAKILKSFSDESAGGAYYNPVLFGVSASSVGESIAANMGADLQITLDLSALDESVIAPGSGSASLKLRYNMENAVYEDEIGIDTADIRGILSEKQDMEPEGSSDGLTSSEIRNSGGEDNLDSSAINIGTHEDEPIAIPTWIIIAVISAAVLLFLLILYAVMKKKPVPSEPLEEIDGTMTSSFESGGEGDAQGGISSDGGWTGEDKHVESWPPTPSRKVTFTALNYKNIRFEVTIPDEQEVVLGRDRRADVILNPEDGKLSGRNTRILMRSNLMLVQDADSTNGTVVNGVPVQAGVYVPVESGQTIRVGSYEYRVEYPSQSTSG